MILFPLTSVLSTLKRLFSVKVAFKSFGISKPSGIVSSAINSLFISFVVISFEELLLFLSKSSFKDCI